MSAPSIVGLWLVGFTSMVGLAQDFTVPANRAPVVDQGQFFSSSERRGLNSLLKLVYQRGGPQIGVLTVPSLNGLPIEDASIRVAEKWKLGTAEKDNGVLFLLSKADRKIRIEVGGGIEGELTDARSKRIIDQVLVPRFRQGKFGQGMEEAIASVVGAIDPSVVEGQEDLRRAYASSQRYGRQSVKFENLGLSDLFVMIFFLAFFFLSLLLPGGRRRGRRGFYGGFGGGGFGGGGGGWSGGGGGFSGGGASGGW